MKKFLSVILTVILALSAAFSLNVFAAEENIFNKIIDVPDLQEVLTQSKDAVDETLTDEDVNKVQNAILEALESALDLTLRA